MDLYKNRLSDHHKNQFGDFPTAHITAHFLNGKVIDVETNKPVKLENGALMHLKVYRKDILDEDIEKFDTIRNPVLPIGTILFFELPMLHGSDSPVYNVKIRLMEDLIFEKKSGKLAVALPCECEVFEVESRNVFNINRIDFKPFVVDSLNQSFFQASVLFRPKNKSHGCNIYKTIRIHNSGKYLDDLRF